MIACIEIMNLPSQVYIQQQQWQGQMRGVICLKWIQIPSHPSLLTLQGTCKTPLGWLHAL